MVAWMAKIFSSARPPGVHHHRIFHKEQVSFFFFVMADHERGVFSHGGRQRSSNGQPKSKKKAEQTMQDEMTISMHIKGNRKEGGTRLGRCTISSSQALACKSSNRERKNVIEERYGMFLKRFEENCLKIDGGKMLVKIIGRLIDH